MIQQTSLIAYREIQPFLNKRCNQVLAIFEANPDLTHTDKELSVLLHWPINCVTPRRGELVRDGLLEKAGTRRCPLTRKKCVTWRLKK